MGKALKVHFEELLIRNYSGGTQVMKLILAKRDTQITNPVRLNSYREES